MFSILNKCDLNCWRIIVRFLFLFYFAVVDFLVIYSQNEFTKLLAPVLYVMCRQASESTWSPLLLNRALWFTHTEYIVHLYVQINVHCTFVFCLFACLLMLYLPWLKFFKKMYFIFFIICFCSVGTRQEKNLLFPSQALFYYL